MKKILPVILLAIIFEGKAQDSTNYKFAEFMMGDRVLPYRIMLPSSFESSKKYPLVVFLHGALQKGTDNEAQLNIGGRYFLREENRSRFPAMVLFPQCPYEDSWAYFETQLDSVSGLATKWFFPFRKEPTRTSRMLKLLLDSLVKLDHVDPARIYIGGISQGGMGVFDLVARYPQLFAAAFPICGAGKVSTAKNFSGEVAVWIFHGEKDDIVPARYSREFEKQLKKLGADVKYSEYPGVFHNSWINAFNEPDLLPWLFSKRKKTN
jgi:predicted peptidase